MAEDVSAIVAPETRGFAGFLGLASPSFPHPHPHQGAPATRGTEIPSPDRRRRASESAARATSPGGYGNQ
jgi:hypothetical protein